MRKRGSLVPGSRERTTVGEGRYELDDLRGYHACGNDGRVDALRARDLLLRRTVTVRRYGPQDPEGGPWRREVDALGVLDHGHVVGLYDGGVDQHGAYTVLQVAGTRPLPRARRAPPDTAARWCLGLADALGHMHDRGVVHHATGPGAVLFDEAQVPRWSGFTSATTGGASPEDRAGDVQGLARLAVSSVHARHVPDAVMAEIVSLLGEAAASSRGSHRSATAPDELSALLARARRPRIGLTLVPDGPPGRRLVAAAAAVAVAAAVAGLAGGLAIAPSGPPDPGPTAAVARPPVVAWRPATPNPLPVAVLPPVTAAGGLETDGTRTDAAVQNSPDDGGSRSDHRPRRLVDDAETTASSSDIPQPEISTGDDDDGDGETSHRHGRDSQGTDDSHDEHRHNEDRHDEDRHNEDRDADDHDDHGPDRGDSDRSGDSGGDSDRS